MKQKTQNESKRGSQSGLAKKHAAVITFPMPTSCTAAEMSWQKSEPVVYQRLPDTMKLTK